MGEGVAEGRTSREAMGNRSGANRPRNESSQKHPAEAVVLSSQCVDQGRRVDATREGRVTIKTKACCRNHQGPLDSSMGLTLGRQKGTGLRLWWRRPWNRADMGGVSSLENKDTAQITDLSSKAGRSSAAIPWDLDQHVHLSAFQGYPCFTNLC